MADTKERLISADDYVGVSHERIKAFLSPKYHADYDQAVGEFALTARDNVAGIANRRWLEQQGLDPNDARGMGEKRSYPARGRAGHTDPVERLKDMDADGVDVSSNYCDTSAFRYLYLLKSGGPEATHAFNSALTEFASANPKRLIVSYQIPIHDIAVAVAEVRWASENGCKSLQLPVFPPELGLPDYWDTRYDPLWTAIQDVDLPICCHIGLNTQLEGLARRDPTPQKGILVAMTPLSSAEALGMWILGGVFERFPLLKVVFVEPGLGWVSWWLSTVDDMQARQGYDFPALKMAPSEYFHRNVFLTFIDEPDAIRHAHERLGVENTLWSSDYPHPVSTWPRSHEVVGEMFGDVSSHERELVLSGNAARLWKL